jgi:predicted neutral ceramidase superfamily lipid hydrolase
MKWCKELFKLLIILLVVYSVKGSGAEHFDGPMVIKPMIIGSLLVMFVALCFILEVQINRYVKTYYRTEKKKGEQ